MTPAAAIATASPLGTIPDADRRHDDRKHGADNADWQFLSTTICSSTPGGPPTNGASLPLSTPEIPVNPTLGTIQPAITELGGTSIDPTMMVVPNTERFGLRGERDRRNLATPVMMAPANATGATATPGVSPPAGC